MSFWTYINGTINVSPMGRTQAEMRYILDTVLAHLPGVTGSEGDMKIHIIESAYENSSSSHDEFDMMTDNLIDRYGCRNRERGWMRLHDEYIIVVEASLRDRMFEETYREFQNWLCRLAKRVHVHKVLVEIKGYDKSEIINDDYYGKYYEMFESPSWCNDSGEPNWCEYLMWKRYDDWSLPLEHIVKYYNCKEADEEWDKILDK